VSRSTFDRREGRRLFGSDPASYDRARPGHAERVYEVLVERCGLQPGTRVLEIGPGTGQATRRLRELGAEPLVAIEPDASLAEYLAGALGGVAEIRVVALEDAAFPAGAFDLAVAASSFHWVDETVGLAKLFGALRPGGWVALWWTLFGDGEEPDAFIRATSPLLEGIDASPSRGEAGRPPHARDSETRLGALARAGFEEAAVETTRWTASWDSHGIRALYGTFSPISRLPAPRRNAILDAIERIAAVHFGGRVERRLLTVQYTARKPGGRRRSTPTIRS
jgi:SAM-dependent methyltransferase